MPLTWRTVAGDRGYGDAALLMRGATQTLNQGFNDLQGVITGREKIGEQNFQNQRTNNTAAAEDIFAKYLTPEALQAAQSSGQLQRELSALGKNVDPNVIRTGADERLALLQNNFIRDTQFQDTRNEAAAKPFLNQAQAYVEAGDDAGIDALRADPIAFAALQKAGFWDDISKDQRRFDLDTENLQATREARAQNRTKFGWSQEDRTREQAELKANDEFNALVREGWRTDADLKASAEAEEAAFLKELNPPQKKGGGGIDYEKLSPEQTNALTTFREKQVNATDVMARINERAQKASLLSVDPAKIQAAYDADIQRAAVDLQMNPLKAAQLSRDLSTLSASTQIDRNIFQQEKDATQADVLNVVGELKAKDEGFADFMNDVGPEVMETINRYTQEGVDLNGETLRLTPTQVKSILITARENSINLNSIDIESAFSDYIASKAFTDQATQYVDYQGRVRELTAAANADINNAGANELRTLYALADKRKADKSNAQAATAERNAEIAKQTAKDAAALIESLDRQNPNNKLGRQALNALDAYKWPHEAYPEQVANRRKREQR